MENSSIPNKFTVKFQANAHPRNIAYPPLGVKYSTPKVAHPLKSMALAPMSEQNQHESSIHALMQSLICPFRTWAKSSPIQYFFSISSQFWLAVRPLFVVFRTWLKRSPIPYFSLDISEIWVGVLSQLYGTQSCGNGYKLWLQHVVFCSRFTTTNCSGLNFGKILSCANALQKAQHSKEITKKVKQKQDKGTRSRLVIRSVTFASRASETYWQQQ